MGTKEKLRHLRSRSGLSVRAVTEAMGYKSPASYNLYETRYDRPYLPVEFVKKLLPCFVGRGHPAIEAHEIWALVAPEFHNPESRHEVGAYSSEIDVENLGHAVIEKETDEPKIMNEKSPFLSHSRKISDSTKMAKNLGEIYVSKKEKEVMIEENFFIEEGEVTLRLPKHLSSESAEDLVSWLALLQRKMQRRIGH